MTVFEPAAVRDVEVFAAPWDVCAALGVARFAVAPFAPPRRNAVAFLEAASDVLLEELSFLAPAPLVFCPARLFDVVVRGDLAMRSPPAYCCRF